MMARKNLHVKQLPNIHLCHQVTPWKQNKTVLFMYFFSADYSAISLRIYTCIIQPYSTSQLKVDSHLKLGWLHSILDCWKWKTFSSESCFKTIFKQRANCIYWLIFHRNKLRKDRNSLSVNELNTCTFIYVAESRLSTYFERHCMLNYYKCSVTV